MDAEAEAVRDVAGNAADLDDDLPDRPPQLGL
jgi:hypothetical protein